MLSSVTGKNFVVMCTDDAHPKFLMGWDVDHIVECNEAVVTLFEFGVFVSKGLEY